MFTATVDKLLFLVSVFHIFYYRKLFQLSSSISLLYFYAVAARQCVGKSILFSG